MNRLSIAVFLALFTVACSSSYRNLAKNYRISSQSPVPDYERLDYWAAHPWKKDPSDSLPKPLSAERNDSLVDVFFIHPTTYVDNKTTPNADINDAELNAKTDYTTILYQASVFNQHCRIFAPRYRQAHLSAFYNLNEEAHNAFDTAYEDVKRAFEVYLKEYAGNRPLIVAGHSQGAMLAKRILTEFFDEGKPAAKRLVAAYIIGWPASESNWSTIPLCQKPDQTGCFCTWRTFRNGYVPDYIKSERPTAAVTNPLTWDTTTAWVGRDHNAGSVLQNFSKIIPQTTDAFVGPGVLWVNKPKFPGSLFFTTKNYHIADINLFYLNLRQNIATRINAYLHAQGR